MTTLPSFGFTMSLKTLSTKELRVRFFLHASKPPIVAPTTVPTGAPTTGPSAAVAVAPDLLGLTS